jgi:hypothetical protein
MFIDLFAHELNQFFGDHAIAFSHTAFATLGRIRVIGTQRAKSYASR